MQGEGFECLGRTFDYFTAKVSLYKERASIHNFKLQDDSAHVTIKTLDVAYPKEQEPGQLEAPLIYVKDFKPSVFFTWSESQGAFYS